MASFNAKTIEEVIGYEEVIPKANSDCVIIIPAYCSKLIYEEIVSLRQMNSIIGDKYDIYLICSEDLNIDSYKEYIPQLIRYNLPKSNFESVDTYNKLCLDPTFYKIFINYKYILIYQLDAFIFYNNLKYFIDLDYDWYGAPWPNLGDTIGNGGFSLRKVSSCIELTELISNNVNKLYANKKLKNEDIIFSHLLTNVAPLEIAAKFSLEHTPAIYLKKLKMKQVPMGCHTGKIANPLKIWNGPLLKENLKYPEVLSNKYYWEI